jgi:hypothetical protein
MWGRAGFLCHRSGQLGSHCRSQTGKVSRGPSANEATRVALTMRESPRWRAQRGLQSRLPPRDATQPARIRVSPRPDLPNSPVSRLAIAHTGKTGAWPGNMSRTAPICCWLCPKAGASWVAVSVDNGTNPVASALYERATSHAPVYGRATPHAQRVRLPCARPGISTRGRQCQSRKTGRSSRGSYSLSA